MYPDILGLTLDEGIDILQSQGYAYTIIEYSAPKAKSLQDNKSFRIVRVKQTTAKELQLVVCKF